MDDTEDTLNTIIPQPETEPDTSGSLSQKKIVRIILIIFSVVFLGALAVLGRMAYIQSIRKTAVEVEMKPTPSASISPSVKVEETQGWHEFISEDFGISIKYPPNWEKKDSQSFENGDLFSVTIAGETQRPQTELYDGATLVIANPITVGNNYQMWARNYYSTHRADETQPLEFSSETINNIEFFKVYTCGLGCFTYYITEQDGYVYQILTSAAGSAKDDHLETIKVMLETITFQKAKMTTMPTPPPGALSFSSQKLGIGFFYPQKIQNMQSVDVKETGNKVFVFMTQTDPQEGQSVEVFSKSPGSTLSEAIKQHFLAGKDESKCYVTITKTEGTITTAHIDFPDDYSSGLEGMSEKTRYCSENYAKTNGIRYFWYDSKHPNIYLFFNIGQYAIPVAGNTNWQDTIRILK